MISPLFVSISNLLYHFTVLERASLKVVYTIIMPILSLSVMNLISGARSNAVFATGDLKNGASAYGGIKDLTNV